MDRYKQSQAGCGANEVTGCGDFTNPLILMHKLPFLETTQTHCPQDINSIFHSQHLHLEIISIAHSKVYTDKASFSALEETLEGITGIGPVLVHYIPQLDRTKRRPDIWLSVIVGISVRVFLDEKNILTGKLNKVDCFSVVGGTQLKLKT